MPRYIYSCEKCDHKFEFLKIRSDEKAECPQCQSPEEFLILDVGTFKNDFVLKGGGWARDKYGGSGDSF